MRRESHNAQMFALRTPPPETIDVGGRSYRLLRVFKHDFFAATCLYESPGGDAPTDVPKIVVKFGRTQPFCGLPMLWYGRFVRDHEAGIYRALTGVPGVPRCLGPVGPAGLAVEFLDGRPMDHLPAPPPGFFDRLRELFDALHARGVGYCDANKRSNILVDAAGRPFLVDYQIALRRRDDWPRPLRNLQAALVRYVARKDLYHLYKHKRRLCPQELRSEEDALSRNRGGLHRLHRAITKPWRALRRAFLRKQYQAGRLVSPTAGMEDHPQPEKETWRKT